MSKLDPTLHKTLEMMIDDLSFKSYFSYCGIFSNGTLFALYKDNIFYIRTSTTTQEEIIGTPGTYLLEAKQKGIHAKFYALPPSILTKLSDYAHWLHSAINELSHLNRQSYLSSKEQIRNLPNMNMSLERRLAYIGIKSVEDLKSEGEISAFVKLVQDGCEPHETLLLKLNGAINKRFDKTIPKKEKEILIQEANLALYKAGLGKSLK